MLLAARSPALGSVSCFDFIPLVSAAVPHWELYNDTPNQIDLELSISLRFTMQPLCPINTETKAYLRCCHQTIHSAFMSIIIFTSTLQGENCVCQSTNVNIQFVHAGTWAPAYLSLFFSRERSVSLLAQDQRPSSLLTFKALPWVLVLSLSAFHFFLFVGYFLSAHSLYIWLS